MRASRARARPDADARRGGIHAVLKSQPGPDILKIRYLEICRQVSNTLAGKSDVPGARFSVLMMTFGQFVDHDVGHSTTIDRDCCDSSSGGFQDTGFQGTESQCFPIRIPQNDPFFTRKSCMNFVRSDCAPRLDCSPGPMEQINTLTHWLDSSNVYGSDEEEARELRL